MLTINLNKKSKIPLHRQVFSFIKGLIENNTLEPGTRLPSTRMLSEKHGISRTVVLHAYEELWGQGYLDSRPGSYSLVRKKTPTIKLNQRSNRSLIDWKNVISENSQAVYDTVADFPRPMFQSESEDLIDMSSLSLDQRLFPIEEFKRCLNTVITNQPELFNYGSVEGYIPLREYIASRLQTHGICVTPEEILITNGTQSSIDLVLRLLTQPGSTILTENPTYFHAFPLMRFHQVRITPIRMNKWGMNIDDVRETLQLNRPALIYTVPNFHNPTGITMSQEVREKLLALSERSKVPIVEDAFEEEMKYFGKVPLPIKSMDKNQIVIYMSSFSKVLFPGIRIGWIAADKSFIKRARVMKRIIDLTSNSVIQAALFEFCRQGYYDLHIRRIHRHYKNRMQKALQTLQDEIPFDQVSWSEPLGGYLIWLKLSDLNITETELHRVLKKHKVLVSHGSLYFHEKPDKLFIRLSISQLSEEEIAIGIRRLKKGLNEVYQFGESSNMVSYGSADN
jgi:GntR family transcriptional regulator/MocR family aminotransferase